MQKYKSPDVTKCCAAGLGHKLGPVAELSYCFDSFGVAEESDTLRFGFCIDPSQWPGLDGVGVDQIEVQIWLNSSPYDSQVLSVGPLGVCVLYNQPAPAGEYTVEMRLIVDGEEVCSEEDTGSVVVGGGTRT
ncbi:MAG: hypothetical protein HQ559_02660 [Lentisphaerae bacterium]|nr:hypothetical protein [Lentisphaerota bacterium]